MDTRDAAEDRKKDDGRSPFETFVENVNQTLSQAPFFLVMVGIIVAWAASYPLWPSSKDWQYIIHTVASVISLLLLVLLENAARRHQETTQEKLNVLAEGLAALMKAGSEEDDELQEAEEKLREAVGLEERH